MSVSRAYGTSQRTRPCTSGPAQTAREEAERSVTLTEIPSWPPCPASHHFCTTLASCPRPRQMPRARTRRSRTDSDARPRSRRTLTHLERREQSLAVPRGVLEIARRNYGHQVSTSSTASKTECGSSRWSAKRKSTVSAIESNDTSSAHGAERRDSRAKRSSPSWPAPQSALR